MKVQRRLRAVLLLVVTVTVMGGQALALCDDQSADCNPSYWAQLDSVTCDSTLVSGYCCIEKLWEYKCSANDITRYVVHRQLVPGNQCVSAGGSFGCSTAP